jgi:hypothetical protein
LAILLSVQLRYRVYFSAVDVTHEKCRIRL